MQISTCLQEMYPIIQRGEGSGLWKPVRPETCLSHDKMLWAIVYSQRVSTIYLFSYNRDVDICKGIVWA